MHPDLLDAGEITSIYRYICKKIHEAGLEMICEGTYQTKQIFWKGNTNAIGALQYEGSNNFEKQLPSIVNLRFNRNNLPEQLKKLLEQDSPPYRRILKTMITHKFTENDEQTLNYIDKLCSLLNDYLNQEVSLPRDK